MRRVALVLGKVGLATQLLAAQANVFGAGPCTTPARANRIDTPPGLVEWMQTPASASKARTDSGLQRNFERLIRQARDAFRYDEERRRRIIQSLGFSDGSACWSSPHVAEVDIDVDKSLFIHDRKTLDAGDFTLTRTLVQLAGQAVAAGAAGTTANLIFQRLWDTQNRSPGLVATPPAGGHRPGSGRRPQGGQSGTPPAKAVTPRRAGLPSARALPATPPG